MKMNNWIIISLLVLNVVIISLLLFKMFQKKEGYIQPGERFDILAKILRDIKTALRVLPVLEDEEKKAYIKFIKDAHAYAKSLIEYGVGNNCLEVALDIDEITKDFVPFEDRIF